MAKRTVHGKSVSAMPASLSACRKNTAHKPDEEADAAHSLEKTTGREKDERSRLRAKTAIRRFCLACQGKAPLRVLECRDAACPLYALRLGPAKDTHAAFDAEQETPAELFAREHPVRAVRRYCMCCCGGIRAEIRTCEARNCALWPFRHGITPEKRKRDMPRFSCRKQLRLPGIPS